MRSLQNAKDRIKSINGSAIAKSTLEECFDYVINFIGKNEKGLYERNNAKYTEYELKAKNKLAKLTDLLMEMEYLLNANKIGDLNISKKEFSDIKDNMKTGCNSQWIRDVFGDNKFGGLVLMFYNLITEQKIW